MSQLRASGLFDDGRGDADAPDALYRQLDAIARRAIEPRAVAWCLPADDLVQLTLERALIALRQDGFRGDGSIASWVRQIARNTLVDAVRSATRERAVLRDYARRVNHLLDQEKILETRGELRAVSARLRRMKPESASVVISAAELEVDATDSRADGLMSVAAISRLRRARASLRQARARDAQRGVPASVRLSEGAPS